MELLRLPRLSPERDGRGFFARQIGGGHPIDIDGPRD